MPMSFIYISKTTQFKKLKPFDVVVKISILLLYLKVMKIYFYSIINILAERLFILLSHLHDDSFLKCSKEFIK